MSNRVFIKLKPEEQKEILHLLDNLNAKKDLVDELAKKIRKDKMTLWATIHELYPEVEDKEATYHSKLGKISYEKDGLSDIAEVAQSIEQLKILRKLRKSDKIDNDTMSEIIKVLNDVE